jgi:hypothetical protein
METESIDKELPSRGFQPRIYGVGAWTDHLAFAYDLVAELKPVLLVELGVDRGESYFTFCQSAAENQTGTRCFGVDTWRGDQHAGGYDETTFAQVSAHNRENYEAFSTLIRSNFDEARERFDDGSIDVLHLDGLHTEEAVRHDVEAWLPKIRPGGILLLHDVGVQAKGFGVWKIWEELKERGRFWTFRDGPGLGVWQKPPALKLPGFLEQLVSPPDERNAALAEYYTAHAAELQSTIAGHWRDGTIRQTAFAQQTIVQVFYSADGVHSEEHSSLARIGHEGWKNVRIELPPGAAASPLRIDFVSALTVIEINSIRLRKAGAICFSAADQAGFDLIVLKGDIERLAHPTALRVKITGIDPQLWLPDVPLPSAAEPLALEMRLRVFTA